MHVFVDLNIYRQVAVLVNIVGLQVLLHEYIGTHRLFAAVVRMGMHLLSKVNHVVSNTKYLDSSPWHGLRALLPREDAPLTMYG